MRKFSLSLCRRLLPSLALVLVLPCLPLAAAELERVNASPNNRSAWISGGVGDEAFASMRSSAADYNVHVLFTGRHGAYLAGIPFSLKGRSGEEIHSGVSDGPLLYLRLPVGTYQLSAKLDGKWQSKRIDIGTLPNSSRLMFVSSSD